MEAASSASSSCWCCAECIQSRRDRHSAAAAAGADDDDEEEEEDADGADTVYNGLLEDESQQLCVDEELAHQDMFDDYLVWIALFLILTVISNSYVTWRPSSDLLHLHHVK